MAVKKVAIITGAVCTFIVMMGVIAYEIVLPEIIGKQYITNLYTSASKLRTDFENLSGELNTPILNNPGGAAAERKAGVEVIKTMISDSRKHLADLQQNTQSLQALPYSGYTSTYGQAVALQERSGRVILQVTDVLDDFESAIAFLDFYTATMDAAKTAIDQFNKTTDLTLLAGQSAAMRQTATKIRQDVDNLQKMTSPEDFATVKIATLQTLNQAADGFDELATGLELGAEAQIDQAAQKIETAGLRLIATDSSSYVSVASKSRSIHSILELNEKLDLILP